MEGNLLFAELEPKTTARVPLAERLRPQQLSEVIGQPHLFEEGAVFHADQLAAHVPSMIFWGPPGCGKTTLARLLSEAIDARFAMLSPISSGVADIKKVVDQARGQAKATLLFVDEIHRFNRAQQDIFLPYLEDGTLILVGATTENPSFALNAALLSRARVVVLNRLEEEALEEVLARAEQLLEQKLPLEPEARAALIAAADGDARYLLNRVEELMSRPLAKPLSKAELLKRLQRRAPQYDAREDAHYNLISALHKSLRGSDVQAALYWLHRMLDGGEDENYILRRLVRFASEDIGLADPQALPQTLAAWDAFRHLGAPEGHLMITQAVIYLATAPKSNAVYVAHKQAHAAAAQSGSLMPPKHILNAPTKLMKSLDYGKDYAYDHDTEHGFSGANYFPEAMSPQTYYQPVERGFEREILKRLHYWQKLKEEKA